MIERKLSEVSYMVNGLDMEPKDYDGFIKGVSINSKSVRPGNLFIPIVRIKNGHDYIDEAIKNGASATLWQKSQPNPPKDIPLIFVDDTLIALQNLAKSYRDELPTIIIGVTGSNGKTTTKDLIDSVLSTNYKVHKTEGNLNSQIGLPLTILQMEEDCDFAVLEMGMSEKGQIERLSTIANPDVAIITMIGQSHLETLGSRKEIASAKLEIVEGLKNGGLFICNGDEPLLREHLTKFIDVDRIKCVTFGNFDTNNVYPLSIEVQADGIKFQLNKDEKTEYNMPLYGRHNVYNAITAIIVGEYFGLSTASINRGLAKVKVTNMRFEIINTESGITVINDAWNASPSSVSAAIETFSHMVGYRHKIIILGDMLELGEREEEYHREVGKLLEPKIINYVFTVGKRASVIAEEAKKRYKESHVEACLDQSKIVERLLSIIKKGDAVLVKGSRGMGLENIVNELL